MNKIIDVQKLIVYPRLFQEIVKHYPLGFNKLSKEFNSFEGIKNLNNIINDKIVNQEYFQRYWERGIKQDIEKELGCKIHCATIGFVPSYGGIIILKQIDSDNSFDQLHFHLSFLGDFFVIQIKRQSIDLDGNLTKKIVVSPTKGLYKEIFVRLENIIRNKFQKAQFLPYYLYAQRLKGLSVIYRDEFNYRIGGAFFDTDIPSDCPEEIVGDVKYKLEELRKL